MAGGWARDGAVEEQIEASIREELDRLRAASPAGAARTTCAECGEPIPEARRRAAPGARLCFDCQTVLDSRPVRRGAVNRRGSKDSQLK